MSAELHFSPVVEAAPFSIGASFNARQIAEQAFGGLIDPVVMVDHFHMTAPTFAPHPHAGMSAVTYMFEDSVGHHMNYDSIGNNGPIKPGSLHWMVAGKGVVHTEQPEGAGLHIHALQIFVNLPAGKKFIDPHAVHVEAEDIPEFRAAGVRVRVVTGQTHGVQSPALLPEPFTLLDGFLAGGTMFEYALQPGWHALVYAVKGGLDINAATSVTLPEAHAVGMAGNGALILKASKDAHFVLLAGPALKEPLVKHGPFVMNTGAQIEERMRAYQRGEFGQLQGFVGRSS